MDVFIDFWLRVSARINEDKNCSEREISQINLNQTSLKSRLVLHPKIVLRPHLSVAHQYHKIHNHSEARLLQLIGLGEYNRRVPQAPRAPLAISSGCHRSGIYRDSDEIGW